MNALPKLITDWIAAKDAERAANQMRIDIEKQMTQLLPIDGAEGSARAEANGYAVRVSYKVSRSVDTAALQEMWDRLDERAKKAFAWKAEVRTTELRALQDMLPEVYKTVATAIETKPAKPSVTVEPVKQREAA